MRNYLVESKKQYFIALEFEQNSKVTMMDVVPQ